MSQDWNQPPAPQQLPPSGWDAPPGGAPMGGPPNPGAPQGFGAPGGFGPPGGVPGGFPGGGVPSGGSENNLALASVICGGISVVSLLCCCVPFVNYIVWVLAPLTGIAAIITGILGLREANVTGVRKNEAIAGIAMGSIGFLMIIVVIAVAAIGLGGLAAFGAANPH